MPSTPSTDSALRRSKRKCVEIANEKSQQLSETELADDIEAKKANKRKTPASKTGKKDLKASKVAEASKSEDDLAVEDDGGDFDESMEEENEDRRGSEENLVPKKRVAVAARVSKNKEEVDVEDNDASFVGEPVLEDDARERWPHRYARKHDATQESVTRNGLDGVLVKAKRHYLQAKVDDCIYNLNDDVYIKAGEGELDYIGRIVEFFESNNHEMFFTAQWFFRAVDTVIKDFAVDHDARLVFLSDEQNDNALNCIVKKIRIVRVAPENDLSIKDVISNCDLYYDMSFSVGYSSFTNLPSDSGIDFSDASSTMTTCSDPSVSKNTIVSASSKDKSDSDLEESELGGRVELSLLDLYSGCGAMSTGLCLGANLSGVSLKTCWAVDMNEYACKSLKFNHPEAEVRNEKAEHFLALLREWEILVGRHCKQTEGSNGSDDTEESEKQSKLSAGEFEVGKILGICYGKTDNLPKDGLKFKVRWKGYGPSDDTWEPVEGLSNCEDHIGEFVRSGYKKKILPLPGTVDVICGGPPCQGISGFNRFRQVEDPFKDEKNKQMEVFMDIVEYLKPKYVLMENVVDILKFAKGYLGRYALSRLVAMRYQARLGILAAGNYGLPQYRMRVFLWGAQRTQKLPQLPLPTHDVVTRGSAPVEFETHVVAFDGSLQKNLEKALLLADAISDLPPVENNEPRDEMSYKDAFKTDFQRYIRLSWNAMVKPLSKIKKPSTNGVLYDHTPLKLNDDDYQRVCRIPKHKGANFRHLPGVIIGPENVVQWDPNVERVVLPSGKPLVPDYAMSFKKGKSSKPFARLWWDETVPTVVTRAQPHNQRIIHPEQDRVLSIRENARLQGFPDYYKLFGPIKERYIQVGNAVAVPVSRALGFGLGRAVLGKGDQEPVFALPQNFPLNM